MAAAKLPDEAFDFYVQLGDRRTYQAVADHFGVSKRTVAQRASEESWKRKSALVAQQSVAKAEEVLMSARAADLQEALNDTVTPKHLKVIIGSLMKLAVKDGNVRAAQIILDRVLGKPKSSALSPMALDLPDGLTKTTDVRVAANALLQAICDGSLSPDDAQKAATILEAARRSIETEDLEKRMDELEERLKYNGGGA